MAREKRTYNNTIYGFDIETTTTDGVTSMYLSSFVRVDFRHYQSGQDVILDNMSPAIFCRDNADVNTYLIKLNKWAKKLGETFIIYCHNLAYEFDYLIKNIDFVKDNFNNREALFIKPRIPLFIRLQNLEIRCSYKLLNASLKDLGKNLGYNKLEIDYDSKYYSFSDLPEVEYEYNERDVRLMLLAVLTECSKWSFIKSVKDIPLTSTGFTRKNNKAINSKKDVRDFAGLCNYQRFFTKEYIAFLERVFSGGYNHANALYVNRPLQNVISFDIISSYIDAILHRNYGNFYRKYNGSYGLMFFKHLAELNTLDYKEVIQNYREPFFMSFMAEITLKNVKPKIIKNNLILPISANKCDNLKGAVLDNGRIYSARLCTVFVTEVDYFILNQFYEFEVVDCSEVWYTKHHKPLHAYILNSTREYLNEKSTLKKSKVKKELRSEDFICEKTNKYIYPQSQINAILAMSTEERSDVLKDNYSRSKNKLNAQYGINVEKLLRSDISYIPDEDFYCNDINDSVTDRVLYREFIKGIYITSYSRLNLFCYALYLMEHCNTRLVYSDTDSWKCYGDIKKAIKINEQYNKMIEGIVNNSQDYNVGLFEFEKEYSYFATLGCKKYVYAEGDKITCTIAGVNKRLTSQAYTELYNELNNDFDLFCKVAFSPCTILSGTVTGKLVTLYNTGEYNLTVTDDNGDTGNIHGYNMVELSPSDYVLMDYDKPIVHQYIEHVADLQNAIIDYIPSLVYRDSDGKVKYKFITDWHESLKILRGEDVNFMNINL